MSPSRWAQHGYHCYACQRAQNPARVAARLRRYSQSAKGRATQHRYHISAKGRAAKQRYERSAKGVSRNQRRLRLGERFCGRAATVEDAQRIQAHVKELMRVLKQKQQADRMADGGL